MLKKLDKRLGSLVVVYALVLGNFCDFGSILLASDLTQRSWIRASRHDLRDDRAYSAALSEQERSGALHQFRTRIAESRTLETYAVSPKGILFEVHRNHSEQISHIIKRVDLDTGKVELIAVPTLLFDNSGDLDEVEDLGELIAISKDESIFLFTADSNVGLLNLKRKSFNTAHLSSCPVGPGSAWGSGSEFQVLLQAGQDGKINWTKGSVLLGGFFLTTSPARVFEEGGERVCEGHFAIIEEKYPNVGIALPQGLDFPLPNEGRLNLGTTTTPQPWISRTRRLALASFTSDFQSVRLEIFGRNKETSEKIFETEFDLDTDELPNSPSEVARGKEPVFFTPGGCLVMLSSRTKQGSAGIRLRATVSKEPVLY